MNLLLVLLLVFFALASIVVAARLVLRDLRGSRPGASEAAEARPLRLTRVKRPAAETAEPGPIGTFDGWFTQLLGDAGLNWNPIAAALLLMLWCIVCGMAVFLLDERLTPAVIVGLVAFPLPIVLLVILRTRRLARLLNQLPPALDILARSMRAGQTLEQAIALVGDHSPQPLAGEFRWCAKQMQMGLALPAVMRSMVQRVRLYDIRILATTLVVHRQAGGNVVRVLERVAQVIRDRLNYRRQLRATTAGGRLSAWMIGLVTPAVLAYFVFFRQDYVAPMLNSPMGQGLLVVAVALEIVGLIWIVRLLRPKY